MASSTGEVSRSDRAAAPPPTRRRPPWPASSPRFRPSAPPPAVAAPSRLRRIINFTTRPPLWVTLLVCAAILAARRPSLLVNPQFWAEDGSLFFFQGWEYGLRALVEPYAGYLHTTQRLVTALALRFDPRWTPAIFVGATFAFTLYVAARTQSARLPFRPHVAYALAIVLVPDASDVLLFLVNLQWVFAGGLLLLLISADARTPFQRAHDTVAALLLGLTGPFSVLFAPLFVWRAAHRRTSASLLLAILVVACALVQAWFIRQTPVAVPDTRAAVEYVVAIPGMRLLGSLLVGHWIPPHYPVALETVLGGVTLLGLAALALRPGQARLERVWLALALLALLAAALLRCRHVLPGLCQAGFASRYFFAPQLIALWLVIALATDARPWLARTAAIALLWMLAVNLPRFAEPALVDQQWPVHAARLRAGEAVTVPINPPDWSFSVPARPRPAAHSVSN